MNIKNIPTYHCGYCSKYYIHKGNAAKHEKFCRNNPNNKHKCFQYCVHLKKEHYQPENGYSFIEFTCPHIETPMYSYKAEKGAAILNFRERYGDGGCVRMPLECPHYEDRNLEILW